MSIPRLELCAAVLLAKLADKVLKALNVVIQEVYLWSDSTIVLAWLAEGSSRWKTFVANRVSEIQQLTRQAKWLHISGLDNPADLISRGAAPRLLKDNSLWWNGPDLLRTSSIFSENKLDLRTSLESLPEQRCVDVFVSTMDTEWDIISKFSNLVRLQRITAYCLRFINNCQNSKKNTRFLTSLELKVALTRIIKHVQHIHFASEIASLKTDSPFPKESRITNLNPFLDDEEYLRVGGRLQESQLTYDSKHQLILPHDHSLTRLIISAEHLRLLHAGQTLLMSTLRQKYWIPNIRRVIKSVLTKCLVCFKLSAKTAQQLMGTLPSPRVQPSRAFQNTGVDYAGPFHLKSGNLRSKTSTKAYIAVFICLATKAIHLEIVTDLSSDSFIAALRRFISRRGRCQNIFSDNGTNFVGARNQLAELFKFLREYASSDSFNRFAAQEELSWHFIPPNAPHFGGLWEAAVKSMKYHLVRSIENKQMTLEELSTLCCQIEACLNSRPLTPLPDNPNEFAFLTPGHFLTGSSLNTLPDSDYATVPVNRLTRWQQHQQTLQYLWHRWSTDYLHTLQQRAKWNTTFQNLREGALVLIKETTPPLQWRTAIVEKTHPGDDGLVRVVTVRTSSGLMKRPIKRLCPFPE